MDASISVKPKQTDVFARLENIVVMNVDSLSIHKKVITKPISVLECVVWGLAATIYFFAVCLLFVWHVSGIIGGEMKMEDQFQVVKPAM